MKRMITLAVIFNSFFTVLLFSSTTFAQPISMEPIPGEAKELFPGGASKEPIPGANIPGSITDFDNFINESMKNLNDARSAIQSNNNPKAFQALSLLEARLLNLTGQR